MHSMQENGQSAKTKHVYEVCSDGNRAQRERVERGRTPEVSDEDGHTGADGT